MAKIVQGDPQVEVNTHVSQNRSTFPLSYVNLDTYRFGEYHPHLILDGVMGDDLPWRCTHNMRSYTLKAPLLQGVQLHKDYFQVNLRSILPFQGERIIINPNIGDDVPADSYTSVSNFLSHIYEFNTVLVSQFVASAFNASTFTWFLKWLVFSESIFSAGSLLSSLGCHLSRRWSVTHVGGDNKSYDIDSFFDYICSQFVSKLETLEATNPGLFVSIDGDNYILYSSRAAGKAINGYWNYNFLSFRQFLEKIRDTADWSFTNIKTIDFDLLFDEDEWDFSSCILYRVYDFPLDLGRLWAYQLAVYEFFSDDKVDYIYSAELFRQYIEYLLGSSTINISLSDVHLYFSWNGLNLPYDWLSSKYFVTLTEAVGSEESINTSDLQYFISLFGYKRSLRYKDYFTGSRTRPLAIGDNNIPVVGGNVNVIDVTRRIQAQKFRNAVNSVGRKFEEYLDGIFHSRPNKDMHEPIFLAHTTDYIGTQEVENTGSAQVSQSNSVTAVFKSDSSKYEFSVHVKESCYIIGITSFDIKRAYTSTIDRSFFTRDRFDMFIPEMQFVGDQPVYLHELDSAAQVAFESPFAYQYHDMQYKINVDRAQGGFVTGMLPGFAFLADPQLINTSKPLSPDFIRARASELDDFYLALTGFSLGTYFHFYAYCENLCDGSRPMAAHPQIL